MKKRVAVGLSGGVDSSVAAYLLKEQGYEVIAFTLKFFPRQNRCCDLDSLYQVQRLCDKLNIAHYTLDAGGIFKREIIDYFIQSYLSAETPNPCSFCNRLIKFGYFFEKIKALDIDYLATGHYVGLVRRNGSFVFKKNKDKKKTQEYFLSLVKPHVLSYLIFPLADYTKEEVKKIARDKNILFKQRKESQDVCFVQDQSYAAFIEQQVPDACKYAGDIRHLSGKKLGRHKGVYRYTYGQRSGLGLGWREPLYVVDIDRANHELIVAEERFLKHDEFQVRSFNWFYRPVDRSRLQVKVRYNASAYPCAITEAAGAFKVRLAKKIAGIAPGQIATFYEDDMVVGGGVIDKVFKL